MVRSMRKWLAILGVVVVTIAVCACSGGSSKSGAGDTTGSSAPLSEPTDSGATSTTAGSATSSPSSDSGGSGTTTPRCDTAMLSAALGDAPGGQPGAGHLAAQITLTNTSGHDCTIDGYAGLGLLDASGASLPASTDRGGYLSSVDPGPTKLVVAPNGSAVAQISWSDVPGTCSTGATTLQITPPDTTTQLTVPWGGSPVCDSGAIAITAFAKGSNG